MYQYKLTWSEVNEETVPKETREIDNIKAGDRFYCKKTVVMEGDGMIAYTKGKTYVSEKDGCITDDKGLIEHWWDDERWPDFFIPTPHPVEKCSCDMCKEAKDKDYFDTVREEYSKQYVENPDHYNSHPSNIECIQITEHYNFCIGNAIKYLWRNGLKSEKGKTDKYKQIEDLQKAIWYIAREIERLQK